LRALRRGLLGTLLAAGAAAAVAAPGSADLSGSIAAKSSTQQSLRAEIAGESGRIDQTTGGLRAAEERLGQIQAALDVRQIQLQSVQHQLLAARDHLVDLENRLQASTQALAANLLSRYEGTAPNGLTVILQAHGFADLLERLDFLHRVAQEDEQIVTGTRVARAAVSREATALGGLEAKERALTAVVLRQRNQQAVIQGALLRQQESELATRAGHTSALRRVESQLRTLEVRQEQIVGQAAPGLPGQIQLDSGGMVQPPPGAPEAVAQVIAAGNAIATLPYVYGGGHASFHADAYDCSGSVSYALAAAGLVTSPLDSTAFESWGEPGPGKWITVYANAGHAFMYVAGWRFDTVALAEGGTRWSSAPASTAGFVARHPAGL
jgi:peptidoglycan hydrolase CwlO-like protein